MLQSCKNGFALYTKFFSPIFYHKGFPFEANHVILSGIPHLFFSGRPSTIARFIIPVIVRITVQAVFLRRPRSHIFQKNFKNEPSRRDHYSSSSIIFISWIFFISTSSKHRRPGIILGDFVRHAMSSMKSFFKFDFVDLPFETTAAFRLTAYQRRPGDNFFLAASAAAFPIRAVAASHEGDDGQAPVPLTKNIFQHNSIYHKVRKESSHP